MPITFDYKGQEYKGVFTSVAGGGRASLWHLTINSYYYGQLFATDNFEWRFEGSMFNELAEHFGNFMIAWYQ